MALTGEEKDHAHKDGHEHQVFQHVIYDESAIGPPLPHPRLQLQGKLQHAILCFLEGEIHQGCGETKNQLSTKREHGAGDKHYGRRRITAKRNM